MNVSAAAERRVIMDTKTFESCKNILKYVSEGSAFYQNKYKRDGFDISSVKEIDDFSKIPFTTKDELRDAYPLGLRATDKKNIVRIHSSSGTTGSPVIIPYTAQDVSDWAEMFARCYETAGITNEDVIQITPGYGLWTAGIGFQAGAERLGAMVVPMGPGNTDKQLKMMVDLESTVFCATSSYALLIAEEVQKRGISYKIKLKKGIIGSERWGDLMRGRIASELGIELFDIYGLTEIYGPGIAIDCHEHSGMHYWSDYVYFEIIDSVTGEVLPEGETGELVITTFRKQGAPLIRYRTHDITRIIPGKCPCGSPYPRIDRIVGRTDDMVKVKGVNIFPGQIDDVLKDIDGVSSEYMIEINHIDGKDHMKLSVEKKSGVCAENVAAAVEDVFKKRIGIKIEANVVNIGELPRSEKKSKRIIDNRYN